jgi:iron complex transport system substrate-binding protein
LVLAGREGTAVIAGVPERIVCVGYQRDTDEALSLGVLPVGVTPYINFPDQIAPWVRQKLGAQELNIIESSGGLPYERIAALAPDLILATDRYSLAEDYPMLSQIAPTLSYVRSVAEDTWQDRVTLIGQALGREDNATRLIAETEGLIRSTASSNPDFQGKTVSFSLINADGQFATVNLPSDASVTFLTQLGFRLAPKIEELPPSGPQGRAQVSEELLDVLDADIVIFSYRSDEQRQQVEQNALFQRIPAVQRGSYVALDVGTAVAMAFPSTLSVPFALETIVPQLAGALTA